MPELPEVEVTRRSFNDAITGALVRAAVPGKPLRWPLGCEPQSLAGRRVLGVRRRGKYLLLDLDQGLLLIHLGMSGSLRFAPDLPAQGAHDHFDLLTDRGTLRLHDPRRFGAVVWATGEDDARAHKLLARLGVEPLDGQAFDFDAFHAGLRASRMSIKQLLLAGRLVVGVGNIYASEALHLAGIRPTATAASLSAARARRLHGAIVQVLARAVQQGGSTLRDFASADGSAGHFQLQAAVYGREGQPCRSCGTPIRQLRQGQRSTFFCPRCQRS